PRSSSSALALLGEKLVHVAGVHLARAGKRQGNAAAVRRQLGPGYTLLRVARWQEGLAVAPGVPGGSVGGALRKKRRGGGRERWAKSCGGWDARPARAPGPVSTSCSSIASSPGDRRATTAAWPRPSAAAGPTWGSACGW